MAEVPTGGSIPPGRRAATPRRAPDFPRSRIVERLGSFNLCFGRECNIMPGRIIAVASARPRNGRNTAFKASKCSAFTSDQAIVLR